jgi:hypothetical protein
MPQPLNITRTGTNWTVDVTSLELSPSLAEKDFIAFTAEAPQPLASYAKTSDTVLTYVGPALPANTAITLYRFYQRDIDMLAVFEAVSERSVNARLSQIEKRLDDISTLLSLFNPLSASPSTAIAAHVAQADPHPTYVNSTELTTALNSHLAASDPHPTYMTAAETDAAYIPLSQRGVANGVGTLDISSKAPAAQQRPSNVAYNSSTHVWTFTWADGSTQSVDQVIESVFANAQYISASKTLRITLVSGATVDIPLNDLADLPEIVIASSAPAVNPTSGQQFYYDVTNGRYWVNNAGSWSGPRAGLTIPDQAKLDGIAPGATANATNAALRDRATHTGTQPANTITGLGSLATKSLIVNADVDPAAAITWGKINKAGAVPSDVGAATSVQGAKADTALQPTARTAALENVAGPGVLFYPAGAGSSPVIATPAQLKESAGLSSFTTTSAGGVVRLAGSSVALSPYTLSVQSNTGSTWLEILNSYGANGGAFFGMTGSGIQGDAFNIYNWQGGPINLFTSPTAAGATHGWGFGNNGHLQCPGGVAPKWYFPAGLPNPATSPYNLVVSVFDSASIPNSYLMLNDNVAWLRILSLDGSGILRIPTTSEATSTTTGAFRTDGIGIGGGAIAVGKRVQFTPVSAASQPNLSLFIDSATGKLSFKDGSGVVNSLY